MTLPALFLVVLLDLEPSVYSLYLSVETLAIIVYVIRKFLLKIPF